ncbi:hypothetical protein EJ04DRAFT_516714 [Polyplosphaeria fusca]|uniref:Uncharacterized protein n=1 Tax=Polyplosphaeria fusca TaxID=682080 RepID=A0A9P4UVJ9_9PLEO|nr:hypothetical protein EJ04DRAFT_516714 [Polyplosphaeria fusca]
MAFERLLTPRNATLLVVSLGGGIIMLKARASAAKQKERAVGDYSVSVDRSGGGV